MHYFLRNSKKKAYIAAGTLLNSEDEIRLSNDTEQLLKFNHISEAAQCLINMEENEISTSNYDIVRVNKEEMALKKLV